MLMESNFFFFFYSLRIFFPKCRHFPVMSLLFPAQKNPARLECRVYDCQASLGQQQQKEEEEKVLDR
jgi:hypothetical protein